MIDAKKVREYIENKNHIKLTPIQYQILKAIIRGDEIYTARGVGRSTLYNGYADYMKNVLGKDTNREIAPDDFDSIFTASMMLNGSCFQKHKIADTFEHIKVASLELFNREFECIYNIPNKPTE